MQGEAARGSARGAAGWHVADALHRCGDLLLHYGGHRSAGGFTLRPDQIGAFRERFLTLAARELAEEDFVPTLTADAEVPLDAVDLDLADSLARLGPHGTGNPEPTFIARRLQVMQCVRRVGRNHLKMKVRQSVRGQVVDTIGFNLGGFVEVLCQPTPPRVDLAFIPERNTWNGRDALQLRLKDLHVLRAAGDEATD
jgi:single-stranded-DNA-specific exonuclease